MKKIKQLGMSLLRTLMWIVGAGALIGVGLAVGTAEPDIGQRLLDGTADVALSAAGVLRDAALDLRR